MEKWVKGEKRLGVWESKVEGKNVEKGQARASLFSFYRFPFYPFILFLLFHPGIAKPSLHVVYLSPEGIIADE